MNSENNTNQKPEIKNISDCTINILLVDDRIENIITIESVIENKDRNIFKALSGDEALRIVQEHEIGLILLDVQMPGMDGFTVARKLKEDSRTKDIAIIFVTAISNEEKYVMQGFEEGAVDYLAKPLNINVLNAKVNVFERLYLQQRELKNYTERLLNLNKQMNEFAYIVSHDLKAPLRGIASLGSFIEEELGSSITDQVKEIIQMLKSRTDRMQNLIDGILHYSRMSHLQAPQEMVDTRQLIESIIDLLSPPEKIKINLIGSFPVLSTEKIKLHEVLQNLISNAIKYNNQSTGIVNISVTNLGKFWEYTIEDTGVGIKPEHIGRIFSIFHTLVPKDKSESTGIGLTIVKKLVEQCGGEVRVFSEFGKGSQFSFTWPQ